LFGLPELSLLDSMNTPINAPGIDVPCNTRNTAMKATTHLNTESAARYLGTLCKHFGHKVPVTHTRQNGHIELPFGACELAATKGQLSLSATADDRAALDKVVQVITSHLERFAFREAPKLTWTYAA
jgi:hypothetical protein